METLTHREAENWEEGYGERFEVRPLTPVIGAEIYGLDLRAPLTPKQVARVERAIRKWRVVFFRDQRITDEDHLRFSRYFGPLTPAHPIAGGMPGHPEIWERKAVSYRQDGNDLSKVRARPPRDYMGWHIDTTFVANPIKYGILRGVEIPECGGDTLWSNLVAAYQGLSPAIQRLVDGLQAVHATGSTEGQRTDRQFRSFAAVHPLVRVHPETGEKVLFLNPGGISHIVGLRECESRALLELLIPEVLRPEYTVRFRWTPDAIAMWDNQSTAHAGPIDYAHFDQPRIVRRTTVAGDVPQGPDGFQSYVLEGEVFGAIG